MVTERDIDIFRSLERTPLTPEQLLRLSATFPELFPTLDRVQQRLRQLANASQVRGWRLDSWQQKLHLYHQHAIDNRDRFKLLVVTTKNSSRLSHILDLAAQLNPDPSYSLVSGVALPEFLAESEPLSSACFRDERNKRMPLLRSSASFRDASRERQPLATVRSQVLYYPTFSPAACSSNSQKPSRHRRWAARRPRTR